MASKNLTVADSESSGDSSSAVSSKTNGKTYKCIACFTPFPTRVMLIQHQSEDEPCRSSELIKNTLTPLSTPQPVLQPPPSPNLPPPNVDPNISSFALLSPTLPPPSPPPRVEPNASSHAQYPTLPPPLPSNVEPNTSFLAPSPTLPPSQPPRVKPSTSSLAPAPARSQPYVAENATSYHHAYLRREIMPIDVAAIAAAAYYDDDRCSSPDNRTLDLISQLDPTRNFLCLIERQSAGQSGNAANGVDAAPGPSEEMGPLDLNFKL